MIERGFVFALGNVGVASLRDRDLFYLLAIADVTVTSIVGLANPVSQTCRPRDHVGLRCSEPTPSTSIFFPFDHQSWPFLVKM